ncbi:hypothetical protein [Arabidopsis thaliana]|uniref:Uncharacterized protein AT4g22510 n=1 Tax=Arabidopsis thaliana TaxID=3702 RepID=Q9SUW8_ARATH|nr:hypothetical protein [Arabidopsis thaliana]CAB79206.1 hypothetical protein [Arabidopsis thaliana]
MPRRLRILSLTASHAHTDTRGVLLRPAKIEQHRATLLVVREMRPSTLTQIPKSDRLRGHTGWAEVKPKKTRLKAVEARLYRQTTETKEPIKPQIEVDGDTEKIKNIESYGLACTYRHKRNIIKTS